MKKSGMTLVEIMISVLIMAVAIMAIIRVFNIAAEGTARGKNVIIGLNLAREVMETVRNTPFKLLDANLKVFKDFPCDGEWHEDVTQFFPAEYYPNYLKKFDLKVDITNLADEDGYDIAFKTKPAKMKKIQVMVRWFDYASRSDKKRSLSLETLVANQIVERDIFHYEDNFYTVRDEEE